MENEPEIWAAQRRIAYAMRRQPARPFIAPKPEDYSSDGTDSAEPEEEAAQPRQVSAAEMRKRYEVLSRFQQTFLESKQQGEALPAPRTPVARRSGRWLNP